MNEFAEAAAMMPDPYRLLWKKEVRSTNDELRNLAEDGMAGGLVLLAESQTSGRGRRGATWFSPAGEGLAFSILLRPEAPKPFWSRLSLVAGLAVAEALERSIPMAEIKWPNDVMVADKKIAGILVEAENDFVIVGIGINVNTTSFPNELPATSLALEKGGQVERRKVLLDVIERLSLPPGTDGVRRDNVVDTSTLLVDREAGELSPEGSRKGRVGEWFGLRRGAARENRGRSGIGSFRRRGASVCRGDYFFRAFRITPRQYGSLAPFCPSALK